MHSLEMKIGFPLLLAVATVALATEMASGASYVRIWNHAEAGEGGDNGMMLVENTYNDLAGWNEYCRTVEFRYQVHYYVEYDQGDARDRVVMVKARLYEDDPWPFDNDAVNPDQEVSMSADGLGAYTGGLHYYIGPNGWIARLEDRDGPVVGRSSSDATFDSIGYFTWTWTAPALTLENHVSWYSMSQAEFFASVQVDDTDAGEEAFNGDWYANRDVPYVRPTLTLTSPVGGETWYAGCRHDIAWDSDWYNAGVDVKYSLDGGATWAFVVEQTENDGVYPWFIPPGTASSNCIILIVNPDLGYNNLHSDRSGPFTIVPTSNEVFVDDDYDESTPGWGVNHFAGIQDGIDATADGGTVRVRDGTYTGERNRNLTWDGSVKHITIRSEDGPQNCVIDCQSSGRGVSLLGTHQTSADTIDGLTITNGAGDGGGIYCDQGSSPTIKNCVIANNGTEQAGGGILCAMGASPTIADCQITGNRATSAGVGIFCHEASPTILRCTIAQNIAGDEPVGRGGGICCEVNSNPTIRDCTITGNSVYDGGGVYCGDDSSPEITGCSITQNTASSGGGGIWCTNGSSPLISGCTIANNAAGGDVGGGIGCVGHCAPMIERCTITGNTGVAGGGVGCDASASPTVTSCEISGNVVSQMGGGIFCTDNSSPVIANCLICGNRANHVDYGGGGVYAGSPCSPRLVNCTIVENSAAYGGAIACNRGPSETLVNCVLWNNHASSGGPEIALFAGPEPSTISISHSDVAGGQDGIYRQSGCTVAWDASNISDDAMFMDADGPDGDLAAWEDNDYRLSGGSACIDDGDNGAVSAGLTTDLAGGLRVRGVRVDMGAYEYEAQFLLHDWNGDEIVSIIGDVPPFVNCAYFGDCPGGVDPVAVGDCNRDGIVSIIGDVPCFVDCVYFGNCPD